MDGRFVRGGWSKRSVLELASAHSQGLSCGGNSRNTYAFWPWAPGVTDCDGAEGYGRGDAGALRGDTLGLIVEKFGYQNDFSRFVCDSQAGDRRFEADCRGDGDSSPAMWVDAGVKRLGLDGWPD